MRVAAFGLPGVAELVIVALGCVAVLTPILLVGLLVRWALKRKSGQKDAASPPVSDPTDQGGS
jgi:hypothetical protein